MTKNKKYYSQIFDYGIESGIIAQIGDKVFMLLVGLIPFTDEVGQCYPKEKTLARSIGKSEKTISVWVRRAKKTLYRGEPVIAVKQEKNLVDDNWEFSSNHYTISNPIREDLISRFSPVDRKLPTGKSEVIQEKSYFPQVDFPSARNGATNDKPSVIINAINENEQSSKENRPFKGITLNDFEKMADTPDKMYCLDIAKWIGESSINFILKNLSDDKCGMRGIEWAYGRVKEEYHRGTVKHKGKLFNYHVKQYKQGKR